MKNHLKGTWTHIKKESREIKKFILDNKALGVFFVIILLITTIILSLDAPRKFVPGTIITIEEGSSVKQASTILKENNIIKSKAIFNFVIQLSDKKTVSAGEYLFDEPLGVIKAAHRIIESDFGIAPKTVTISEGMTVIEIAKRMEDTFVNFNTENFISLATKYEGYLFPDTYKISRNADEIDIIEILRANFNDKMLSIKDEIENSGKTLDEIITMASIVEKEATRDTIQQVSDVLWNRIETGMPLQVDATFVYSIGKNSFTVTKDELRDENDSYNTYVHEGLPPTPISNPGMEAILASIHSQPTEYFFFLTGRDGKMYFATNFEGHKRNRALHLD